MAKNNKTLHSTKRSQQPGLVAQANQASKFGFRKGTVVIEYNINEAALNLSSCTK